MSGLPRLATGGGDKANPQTTFHLNEGHVTDMCEIGGDLQSQRDVHYEVKVPSALTKTRQAGQGSAAHGGCCASLGHKFGFGNTLDQTLLKVLGAKSAATSHRARSSMRPAKA